MRTRRPPRRCGTSRPTRILVTDISRWREYGQAHREAFGDTMPAATMIEIARLVDPRMLVEVEAVAYRPGIGA